MVRSFHGLLLTIPAAFLASHMASSGETTPPVTGLMGTYSLVSGEKDGKPIPEDRIKGSHVTFTKDRIVGTDKDSKETYVATYKLFIDKTPHRIEMVSVVPSKGETAPGLVEMKGDTVTIIYSVRGAPAPTEFKTKADQHLFVLKLAKK